MEPFRGWADVPPDLLCRIGDRLDLKWYSSARGACTAWRRALVPPSPALLVVTDGRSWCPYAASLTTRRFFELTGIVSGSRCVGSSNGWLALSVDHTMYGTVLALVNPIAALEIILPPLIYGHENESRCDWVSKVVFTPSPAKDDFAAAAICDIDRIAYVTAGAKRWAVMDPVRLTREVGDQLTDVVYTEKGNKFYCLSKCGDVHVLRLSKLRRRKPANADDAGPSHSQPEFSVFQPPPPPSPPCPLPPPPAVDPIIASLPFYQYQEPPLEEMPLPPDEHEQVPRAWQGPHLNPPATLEPLLPLFDPAAVFAPPNHTVSAFTSAKHLVFCGGNLYQVWRNASCAVTLQLPAWGQRRVAENEVLVLRYYPRRRRQPCWDVVKDLGGYAFFVGRNNAVSMYAEGVPGLRGMVFDMESWRSTPCGGPLQSGFLPGRYPYSTICWYF